MYRWCARHGRLIIWLWTLFSLVIVSPLIFLGEISFIWLSLYLLFMAFLSWGFVNACARTLLNKAVGILNDHCDPSPLLLEVNDQLTYSRSKTYNQILTINQCVAWRVMGRSNLVLPTLEQLNIDQHSGTLLQTKVVYYNNLADAYIEIEDVEKALIWQTKARQIVADLKNQKMKAALQDILLLNSAAIEILRGQYDEAEHLLMQQAGKKKSLKRSVAEALLFAQIDIHQGRIESARDRLNFVIANGNQLDDVLKARKMMDTLPNGSGN